MPVAQPPKYLNRFFDYGVSIRPIACATVENANVTQAIGQCGLIIDLTGHTKRMVAIHARKRVGGNSTTGYTQCRVSLGEFRGKATSRFRQIQRDQTGVQAQRLIVQNEVDLEQRLVGPRRFECRFGCLSQWRIACHQRVLLKATPDLGQ